VIECEMERCGGIGCFDEERKVKERRSDLTLSCVDTWSLFPCVCGLCCVVTLMCC
jgi:hypothetical protein